MDLFLTREESGVSNSGLSEKNSMSLSFLVKSLMSLSISGKLCCGVGVIFKPSLKIWICEGVKLTLDKFKILRWIISSYFGWLLLQLGNEEKKLSLTELLKFSSTWFRIPCLSGTIKVCSFCWSLLLISLSSSFLTSTVSNLSSFSLSRSNNQYNSKTRRKTWDVSTFHNINLIQSKRQPPNLKKLLSKAEYREVLSRTFNCSERRC